MPNTLAHFAFQGAVTHGLLRAADVKWVALGCVIPDLPWILNRAVRAVAPLVSLYDLRAYVIIQSSLLFGILLAGGLALVAERSGRIFLILILGVLLHLVLDALQIKWANGVHLLAPLSWELLRFDLFWPEHLISYVLTAGGLLYMTWAWGRRKTHVVPLEFGPSAKKRVLAAGLFAAYFLLPTVWLDGPSGADNHFLRTLREESTRVGKYVEFDRNRYTRGQDGAAVLRTFAEEEIVLTGDTPATSGKLSVRGRFTAEDTVQVIERRAHAPWIRDAASYIGLFFVAALWISAVRRESFARRSSQPRTRSSGLSSPSS